MKLLDDQKLAIIENFNEWEIIDNEIKSNKRITKCPGGCFIEMKIDNGKYHNIGISIDNKGNFKYGLFFVDYYKICIQTTTKEGLELYRIISLGLM